MKKPDKLLIIGGYGTFGGRLVKLLASESELTLLVAGRSLHKATTFVDGLSGDAQLIPERFDRDGDVAEQITRLAPDIVIDASGPFQAYDEKPYRVAEAAISIGAHYLDLADGTDFVCNITSLDAAAKKKDVFVLAGTSTCPALTAAVTRALSSNLLRIESITGGIAPSPFAGMGRNVVQAIAGYAGKPVTVLRNGDMQTECTFVSTRRFTIAPPGCKPLSPMTFSLIDVPDLQMLAELGETVGNTWFGVSTLPAFYHGLLRFLARGVKTGFLPTLAPLAGSMYFVMNRLSWGEHRGGMFMEVLGTDMRGQKVRRSWHLLAEGDDGPNVPALAANAIVRQCLENRFPEAGARSAKDCLDLADFQPMFDSLNITTGERALPLPAATPLFQQVLGSAWTELPEPVRDLHAVTVDARFSGRASVKRGKTLLTRLVGWFAGFPNASIDVPVTVSISHNVDGEFWQRDFGGSTFSSEMSTSDGPLAALLCERFGPARFGMALVAERDVLHYVSRRWTFFGLPMPKWLMPNGEMYETVVNGKFVFHVEISLPLIGHVVTYDGWLKKID